MVETIFELRGHIIDSLILPRAFGVIMDLGGEFQILDFKIGRSKTEHSYARMRLTAENEHKLHAIMEELQKLGATETAVKDASTVEVTIAGVAPEHFYSTTNHLTWVHLGNDWVPVEGTEMDCLIVVSDGKARTIPMGKLKVGDQVVVNSDGIKIHLPERSRSADVFEFMSSMASSEKPTETLVGKVAQAIRETKEQGKKLIVVAGPAVVHTGGREALAALVREGYVNALFAGNALAVHDIEVALMGTSLGVDLKGAFCHEGGHRHHLIAINTVRREGSIAAAVEHGLVKDGVMHACVTSGVPFVLAGSIRDDGPLPEVITDVMEAQDAMREALEGCGLVLMLSTLLHSVAVGNMIPSHVKTICVDINPASVTKLLDRGSAQAIGITTDVGLFLPKLRDELLGQKGRT